MVDVIEWLKEEFIKVCKSGDAKKVEAAIMNGAAVLYGHTENANLLRSYVAK